MARRAHPDYIDYLMSEKFGTDWKRQDARRMTRFIEIMHWEAERESKKQAPPAGTKFRPRG